MSRASSTRRALVLALAGAPFAARAQQRKPRIATLRIDPAGSVDVDLRRRVESSLAAAGIPAIEFRAFLARGDSVPELDAAAREAVAWAPDALLTPGPVTTMAAQKATKTIPVVFFSVPDPDAFGFVQSPARPGGNLTGSAWDGAAQTLKRLELGREMMPRARTVLAVYRRREGALGGLLERVRARFTDTAARLGLEVREEDVARGGRGLRATLAQHAKNPPHLVVGFGPYDWEPAGPSDAIAALLDFERRHGVLSVFEGREALERGGAIAVYGVSGSLGPAITVLARVLKGASPAVVPVEYGTKYAIGVNRAAAKARGLAIPDSILVRAEEVLG